MRVLRRYSGGHDSAVPEAGLLGWQGRPAFRRAGVSTGWQVAFFEEHAPSVDRAFDHCSARTWANKPSSAVGDK